MSESVLCGDFRGEEGWISTECQLPKDHEGDHEAVVTWPRWERTEPGEPTAAGATMQKVWARMVEQQLRSTYVAASPVIHPDWTPELVEAEVQRVRHQHAIPRRRWFVTYSGPRPTPRQGHWIGRAYASGAPRSGWRRWRYVRGLSFASKRRVWAFWVHVGR